MNAIFCKESAESLNPGTEANMQECPMTALKTSFRCPYDNVREYQRHALPAWLSFEPQLRRKGNDFELKMNRKASVTG